MFKMPPVYEIIIVFYLYNDEFIMYHRYYLFINKKLKLILSTCPSNSII